MKTLLTFLLASVACFGAPPVITGATINYPTNVITISGTNLSQSGVSPTVAFSGTGLTVTSFSTTSVAADLPAGITNGTYLLSVTTSKGTGDFSVAFSPPSTTAAILIGECSASNTSLQVGVIPMWGNAPGQCFNGSTPSTISNFGFVPLVMPSAGTLKNLIADFNSFQSSGAPTNTGTASATVYDNGTATSMTCSVTFSPSNSGSLICTDNTNTVAVAAGDQVVVVLDAPTILTCAPSGSCAIAANVAIEKQ